MDVGNNELVRDVFYALARRYFFTVGPSGRQYIELFCLLQVLSCFGGLGLLHYYYALPPPNCLANRTGNWSGDGILRVEVKYKRNQIESESHCAENATVRLPSNDPFLQSGFEGRNTSIYGPLPLNQERRLQKAPLGGSLGNVPDELKKKKVKRRKGPVRSVLPWSLAILGEAHEEEVDDSGLADEEIPSETGSLAVMEYALEYGYLHLSRAARHRLNLTITTVTLDPSEEPCFGPALPRYLLQFTYGFDILLLCSFQEASENLGMTSKGYLRNVFSGQYYHFVGVSIREAASIFILVYAALLLVGSAIVLSILLRLVMLYVPRLLVTFIEHFDRPAMLLGLIHVLILNLAITSITIVLAEFFSDPLAVDSLSTVIFFSCMVWAADIFNSCCCHTVASKRYFGRFFYLFAYMFVVYHVRYKGLFSEFAQMTAWACIQCTMVFFLHRIELPAVIQLLLAERVHMLAGDRQPGDRNQPAVLTVDNQTNASDDFQVDGGRDSQEESDDSNERLERDESDLDLDREGVQECRGLLHSGAANRAAVQRLPADAFDELPLQCYHQIAAKHKASFCHRTPLVVRPIASALSPRVS